MKDKYQSHFVFLRHLSFWVIIVLYEVVNEGWKSRDRFSLEPIPEMFSIIPIAILLTYYNLYVLMPRYYFTGKYFVYSIALIVLLLAGGALQRFCSYVIWVPLSEIYNPLSYQSDIKYYWNSIRILRNSFLFFPIVVVAMLLRIMRVSVNKEKRFLEMEKQKKIAELNLLKAQINPHFFFNTLNSLYALTLKNSEKAPELVLRLSDLMHYMLYEASADTVLLKDEIRHLEGYIYIEKMRFSDRLDLSFQYSGDLEGKSIFPLLLLPFIENAFKHGIANHAGWVTISINVLDNELFLKVENSFRKVQVEKPHGIGLANVKRRLDLTYGDKYKLVIHTFEDVFEIELKINL
ncbi:sensor histidine kinase [Flavobacterium cupreum]|nr:histidine kinase [Flavobacterium cupreum]